MREKKNQKTNEKSPEISQSPRDEGDDKNSINSDRKTAQPAVMPPLPPAVRATPRGGNVLE